MTRSKMFFSSNLLWISILCNASSANCFYLPPAIQVPKQFSVGETFLSQPANFPQPPNALGVLSIRGGGSSSTLRDTTRKVLANPAVASLVAGSVAGAIGVGVAFPLDTLKTKSQVLGQRERAIATGGGSASTAAISSENSKSGNIGMLQLISLIYKTEGLSGFFGGVKGMMAGQALIKSVAFSVNTNALALIQDKFPEVAAVVSLLLAACFSGFITSFLVAPIERIKVMMQATGDSLYKNELECLQAVVDSEGWGGLLGRGLGPTLAREVPSYGLYFLVYGLLISTPVATSLGKVAPLIFGAMSGMASWIPVYPVDVVKTLVQNTDGGEASPSAFQVAKNLYEEGGVGAFFDGLTPKMLRAAVNHAVTFYIYDIIMVSLTG